MSGATKLLIRGGQVYDHDGDVHHPGVADILIEGDRIAAVGTNLAAHGEHDLIDASGRLVIPGLINAHYHSHDTLCRGLFEELPLEMWLLYTIPMGQSRSREEVRARTLVGALESLRCGITTVQDMLGLVPLNHEYTDVVLSAYREAGIRVEAWRSGDAPALLELAGGGHAADENIEIVETARLDADHEIAGSYPRIGKIAVDDILDVPLFLDDCCFHRSPLMDVAALLKPFTMLVNDRTACQARQSC